jgi:hypothetical protein
MNLKDENVNAAELSDEQLEVAAGGILWAFVAAAVVGWEAWDAVTGDTRKAEAPTLR